MPDIFKTVLMLSLLGSGITLFLIILKPFIVKRFSARWQYCVWMLAALCMIVPVWKAIPSDDVQKIVPMIATEQVNTESAAGTQTQNDVPLVINDAPPMEYRKVEIGNSFRIGLYDLFSYAWLAGMCIFIISAFVNYFVFILKKKRCSIDLFGNTAFEDVKNAMDIKRKIRLRISGGCDSPMLIGAFFPVIYIPGKNLDINMEKMVFRHELTHYKHGDLICKWIVLFVNAVHWFNPLVYILGANISEACELTCDMSVTSDMDEENKNFYMKTILTIGYDFNG